MRPEALGEVDGVAGYERLAGVAVARGPPQLRADQRQGELAREMIAGGLRARCRLFAPLARPGHDRKDICDALTS